MNARQVSRGAACCWMLALLVLVPESAASQNVGAAAAVRPSSTGTPPGGSARTLEVGSNIVARERIQTSESGSLQVMFVDKTTMTVGPSSDLLIDEFVYDPGAGTGQFAASLTKGALRFVGGQISHTAGATINTPSATIGIRGGGARIALSVPCQTDRATRRKSQGGNASGRSANVCDQIVCMLGQCDIRSTDSRINVQLTANQALDIGSLGAVQYSVTSVSGDGGLTTSGTTESNASAANLSAVNDEVQKIISEQAPEPPPPPSNQGP